MRHNGLVTDYDPKRGVSIASLAFEYPAGFRVPEHAHGSDQVIYAIRGAMEVSSSQSVWLVPPQSALWIPAHTSHGIVMPGRVSMRTLYLRPGLASPFAHKCAVFHVTPLLRELIVETVRIGRLRWRNLHERALRDLLILHLKRVPRIPTFVTLPSDPRALAVAQAVLVNPAQAKSMAALCCGAGASVRTVERAFRKEVGTGFASWRRQVRLVKAIELLVTGCSIKEAAFAVGYHQPSAFVEMFRHALGATPKAWTTAIAKQT